MGEFVDTTACMSRDVLVLSFSGMLVSPTREVIASGADENARPS